MLPSNILIPLAHYSHWEYPGSKIVEILPSTIFKVKCEFIASQSYQRKQHNDIVHKKIKKKVYSCKKCEFTTSIPGYLKVHKELYLNPFNPTHGNILQYDYCSFEAPAGNMRIHMLDKHD